MAGAEGPPAHVCGLWAKTTNFLAHPPADWDHWCGREGGRARPELRHTEVPECSVSCHRKYHKHRTGSKFSGFYYPLEKPARLFCPRRTCALKTPTYTNVSDTQTVAWGSSGMSLLRQKQMFSSQATCKDTPCQNTPTSRSDAPPGAAAERPGRVPCHSRGAHAGA